MKKNKIDYISTFIIESLVILSNFLAFKLAISIFGDKGFGEYVIARRAMNILAYPMLLGLGVSLPRFMVLQNCMNGETNCNTSDYFIASILLILPANFIILVGIFVDPEKFSYIFFGNYDSYMFSYAIYMITLGLQLHTLIYGYFRGIFCLNYANLLRLLSFGIIPPFAIILSKGSSCNGLFYMGGFLILTSVVVIIWIISRIQTKNSIKILINRSVILLKYGLPRVPGEIALFTFFSFPIFLVSHRYGIEEAGFLSFGISLLQIFGALHTFTGIVLLTKISQLNREKNYKEIIFVIRKSLAFSLTISIIITCLLMMFSSEIISRLMGVYFYEKFEPFKSIIYGVVPYTVYIVLRNPIDAISSNPYNSINIVICTILIFSILPFIKLNYMSFVIALILSILAIMTFYSFSVSLEKSDVCQ